MVRLSVVHTSILICVVLVSFFSVMAGTAPQLARCNLIAPFRLRAQDFAQTISHPDCRPLPGSLTPTALVQAAKQLPEDFLGPFAGIGQRGAAHRSAPLAAASFSLILDPSNYAVRLTSKKKGHECPQHDSFRTPLSPWWRSTMARNSSRGT